MLIRQESPADFEKVYALVEKAFATAEHSDGNEHNLVTKLRTSDAFVPKLSLVAELNQKIIGHIMFTKASVGNEIILVLAPLAVLPEFQKQGVGSALIKEAHCIAKTMGYQYISVLGSEKYYPRFGYEPAKNFGLSILEEIPAENFMLIKLQSDAKPLTGSIKYAKEFGI